MPTYYEIEEWQKKLRELREAKQDLRLVWDNQQRLPAGSAARDSTMSSVDSHSEDMRRLSTELRAVNVIDEWGELTHYAREELFLREPHLPY